MVEITDISREDPKKGLFILSLFYFSRRTLSLSRQMLLSNFYLANESNFWIKETMSCRAQTIIPPIPFRISLKLTPICELIQLFTLSQTFFILERISLGLKLLPVSMISFIRMELPCPTLILLPRFIKSCIGCGKPKLWAKPVAGVKTIKATKEIIKNLVII